MKKIISYGGTVLALASMLAIAMPAGATALPNWDVTGNYVVAFDYLGTPYSHDVVLAQDSGGNIAGNGGYPAGGSFTYAWTIDSGSVVADAIHLDTHYTVGAVCNMTIDGTIDSGGTMSGIWSDNCDGSRTGTWSTTSGNAVLLGTLSAEDFGVVINDAGVLGIVKGYTAGFGLTDATFAGASSVVVKLYSAGDVLMQTNTAILPKFNLDITGIQFSSPFDVSGTFNYVTDGYWTNVRESQYGQSVPATKVVATVTLANGKVVTATNTNLTGNPTTIYPVTPTTPQTKDACKNNGWKTFSNPTFKNQGQCVSYLTSNDHAGKRQ
ncbi:MAG: hypothetical protein Q8P97_01745 [bacterium]|nr:hypothetical protein [bacterium]